MDFTIPDELKQLQDMVRDFVKRELLPWEKEIDRTGEIPPEPVRKMKEMGFFGLTIPTEYGGGGLGALAFALVAEELSKAHNLFRVLISINNGIGSRAIVLDGTEEQKTKYLPRLASGEYIGCFALSEPGAGSDAAAMETSAVRRGDHYVLNGTKHFITNAPIADLFTVMALTDREKRARGGITAFIIEKGTPGLSVGRIQETMGSKPHLQAEVILEDCLVPAANVIGQEGIGYATALKTLGHGRIALAAAVVGVADRLLEMSKEYAKVRTTFGQPIANYQAIQWMLADSATEIYAARTMTYHAAWKLDQGERAERETAMAKLFASEMVGRVADRALQIHGAMGYACDLPIERIYRDMRLARIVEGTSEIQRLIIARDILKG